MKTLEQRIARGDPQAYEELFDCHAETLLRLAYSLLLNAAEAEDAVQETLLHFVRTVAAGRYHSANGSLEGYLRRCVRNRCIDRLRKAGALHLTFDETLACPSEGLSTPLSGPSQSLDDKRLRQRIEAAIHELPALQRAAIVLRVLEERPLADIAQELDISIDHVKNLLGRARKRLREKLEPIILEQ